MFKHPFATVKSKLGLIVGLALATEGGSLVGRYPFWEEGQLFLAPLLVIMGFIIVSAIPFYISWFRTKPMKMGWRLLLSTVIFPVNLFLLYFFLKNLMSPIFINPPQYMVRILAETGIGGFFVSLILLGRKGHQKEQPNAQSLEEQR